MTAYTVCCATATLLQLTFPLNSSLTVKNVLPRCGRGCRGVGLRPGLGPFGCAGLIELPDPHAGGQCDNETQTTLQNFVGNPNFGGTDSKGVCRGPVCSVTYGKPVKVHSKKNRPVRVHALPSPGQPFAGLATIVRFADNHIPPRSDVKGPMTIDCTNHSKRLTVGAGTLLKNVRVNCSDDCPVHVKLKRNTARTHTRIINVSLLRHVTHQDILEEAKRCSTLITPVAQHSHPRDFLARGKVTVESRFGHGIAVANVNGELEVINHSPLPMNVTLLDTLEDSNGRLRTTFKSSRLGKIKLHNITAIMDVFSQEYLVRFFGPAPTRNRDLSELYTVNIILVSLIIMVLTGAPDSSSKALKEDSEE